jgi:hypothetical protein
MRFRYFAGRSGTTERHIPGPMSVPIADSGQKNDMCPTGVFCPLFAGFYGWHGFPRAYRSDLMPLVEIAGSGSPEINSDQANVG